MVGGAANRRPRLTLGPGSGRIDSLTAQSSYSLDLSGHTEGQR